MDKKLEESIKSLVERNSFSGVVLVKNSKEIIHQSAYGYSNRSEALKNMIDTRFGIASGCKLFTAVGILMLVESGKLTYETYLRDCLAIPFPHLDEHITIHQLLTHTSGIPDYFDEAVMDNFEELWDDLPMYKMNRVKDFLPMFQNREMMFPPGGRFHYNNAGYIVLGLIIEQATGMSFTDYIEKHIFQKIGMLKSGYFSMDQLPKNTALGYIKTDESWKTNIYSVPVKGGPDGGAFVSAADMIHFWEALFSNQFLSEKMNRILLTPHVKSEDNTYYGYGIWIDKVDDEILKYHVMGYDPGVSFHSAVYPESEIKLAILSNKSSGAYDLMEVIEESLLSENK
ncbi:penicillin-binding protein [Oceanobacillus zhaokaii]|uniref:Penicillin-binding protein n=1 Tax=Oceanobacillus zhaokaii TaxID=2052660 RepID=A0A345PD59_9BACI|nr:serine hydrolase [Oceanobacillus zhaokaii]AXI07939.1 penicillin-binding protein [Oceanobacillus zhaokaii]